MSIETGLEAYQIEHVRNSPGALGTVMNNLAALGVGLARAGDGDWRRRPRLRLAHEVRKLPVDPANMSLSARVGLTPTYTKPMRQGRRRLRRGTEPPRCANALAAVRRRDGRNLPPGGSLFFAPPTG